MAEKMLNTRIQLKYDSWAAWSDASQPNQGANLVLKTGEIGICNIPAQAGQVAAEPAVIFKVGDGTTPFKDLPWASAKAADVHTWAKKSETEFKAWVQNLVPVEVIDGGEGKFVTDVTVTNDADGHHITITRADVDWEDLTGTSPIGDGDLVITIGEGLAGTNLATTMNSTQDASTTITHGAQPTEGTNATTVADERTDNTFISNVVIDKFGHVAKVETKNAFFADNDTITKVESADKYVKVETAQNQFTPNEENVFNVSIDEAELKALIGAETTAAMEFKGATASLPTGTLNKGDMYKVTASFEVTAAQDAQGVGFTTQIGDAIVYEGEKWYLIPSGDDIEDTWRQVLVNDVSIENSDLEIDSGTTSTEFYGEFKVNGEGVKTKLVIPNASEDVAGLVKLGETGGAEVYGTAANLINALDFEDVEGDFVTVVTQTDGKITATKARHGTSYLGIAGKDSNNVVTLHTDIQLSGNNQLSYDIEDDQTITFAPIAVTGNVNDLVQTTGDVLVFNCGTATEVI